MSTPLPELKRLEEEQIDFLHADEKCHMFFRRHGMYLVFSLGKHFFFFFFFFLFLLPFSLWLFGENWRESASAVFIFRCMGISLLFFVHWLFLDIITYFLGFMMVTNRRIIEFHKSVFLLEEMKEIPFRQITNIHHEKNGFLQNIMNYGVVRIHSNVQEPVRMRFVPHVEEKCSKISSFYARYTNNEISPQKRENDNEMANPRMRKRDRFIYEPLRKVMGKIGRSTKN
jgi:hypothetical protein